MPLMYEKIKLGPYSKTNIGFSTTGSWNNWTIFKQNNHYNRNVGYINKLVAKSHIKAFSVAFHYTIYLCLHIFALNTTYFKKNVEVE